MLVVAEQNQRTQHQYDVDSRGGRCPGSIIRVYQYGEQKIGDIDYGIFPDKGKILVEHT